ncbi:MAG: potassium channel protein [candidate division WOR-3 bacterium]
MSKLAYYINQMSGTRLKSLLGFLVIGFALILCFGTIGYHLIEQMSWLDALYMAVITISTVGFQEVKPLSDAGKFFTIVYVIFGLTFVSYNIFNIGQLFFENTIVNFLTRKNTGAKGMKNHYIICGFGRIGSIVARELHRKGQKFVIIEKDPERIKILQDKEYPFIEGDATEEETLIKAGIKEARGVACALNADADNLYVTLTAKELNPNILIISRAENENSVKKILKAGATRVITPYEEGALKIAQFLTDSETLDLVDFFIKSQHLSFIIKDIEVDEKSELAGKSLRECRLREKYGALVIAIKRNDKTIINPSPDEVIKAKDTLVVIGDPTMIEKMKK